MIDDYLVVSGRAFEEPYLDDLRALVRVCGDHFEHHGDPRGTLIALGEARYDATGPRAHELQSAIDAHVLVHHDNELGALADLVRKPRTCVLEWRCGQLFGASLDTRHLERSEIASAVRSLLYAPAAYTLRRLTVRARTDRDVETVVSAVRDRTEPRPPLEHVELLREIRPRRLGGWETSSAAAIRQRYPRLCFYAERDAVYSMLVDLPMRPEQLAEQIRAVEAPLDIDARVVLGRALTMPEAATRAAALAKIEQLGEHAAWFVDILAILLQPGVVAPQLPIVTALRAIGRVARRALPVLVQIPGRTKYYDLETRRAAGQLVAAMR